MNNTNSVSKEENLELICPNCHSLTPNYRYRNQHTDIRQKGNRGRNESAGSLVS